jgi:hypothetical protein
MNNKLDVFTYGRCFVIHVGKSSEGSGEDAYLAIAKAMVKVSTR